jgi:hypothetical protein
MSAGPGLCAACNHARVVQNRRGSRFWLCSLSRQDPRYPRYPNLPVLRCAGFERGVPGTHTPVPEPGGSFD